MKSTRKLWEERSKKFGLRKEGVLPKFLPPSVNAYLDNWMYDEVKKQTEKVVGKNIKVLDLGCGYGRISKRILSDFPHAITTGVDIAKSYVKLYNKELYPKGKAITGDIKKLPFADSSYDVVVVITTLMYLVKKEDRQKALQEIHRVLKPGGKFVVIERNIYGHGLVTLGGIVEKLRGKRNKEITAVSFNKNYLAGLLSKHVGELEEMKGIPCWTLLLPFSIIISFLNNYLAGRLLVLIRIFDRLFSWVLTPSWYISYTGKSK